MSWELSWLKLRNVLATDQNGDFDFSEYLLARVGGILMALCVSPAC